LTTDASPADTEERDPGADEPSGFVGRGGWHLVAFLAALALVLAMSLDWYTTEQGEEFRRVEENAQSDRQVDPEIDDRAAQAAENEEKTAWQADALIDRLILVACVIAFLGAVAAAFMRSAGRRPEPPWHPSAIATVAGLAGTLLILYRMFQPPGLNDAAVIKAGAPLGLIAVGLVTIGSRLAVLGERDEARPRRDEEPEEAAEVEEEAVVPAVDEAPVGAESPEEAPEWAAPDPSSVEATPVEEPPEEAPELLAEPEPPETPAEPPPEPEPPEESADPFEALPEEAPEAELPPEPQEEEPEPVEDVPDQVPDAILEDPVVAEPVEGGPVEEPVDEEPSADEEPVEEEAPSEPRVEVVVVDDEWVEDELVTEEPPVAEEPAVEEPPVEDEPAVEEPPVEDEPPVEEPPVESPEDPLPLGEEIEFDYEPDVADREEEPPPERDSRVDDPDDPQAG
jgi:hypothetical protein